MKLNRIAIALTVLAVFGAAHRAIASDFVYTQPLDYPGVAGQTRFYGISGSNAVGIYSDSSRVHHGLVYNSASNSWQTLDDPSSMTSGFAAGTEAIGISGNKIVGGFFNETGATGWYGFLYDGASWTTLNAPGSVPSQGGSGTQADGISGNNIVGYYGDSLSIYHGFLYDGMNYTPLDDPSAGIGAGLGTFARSIDGNNIVGSYSDASNAFHGYLYNDLTKKWTTFDYPGAVITEANGISGNYIVGDYGSTSLSAPYHHFLYNLSSGIWTTFDDPLGAPQDPPFEASVSSVDGGNISGWYTDPFGTFGTHGFIAAIPEPTSVSLLTVGMLALCGWGIGRRRRMQSQATPRGGHDLGCRVWRI